MHAHAPSQKMVKWPRKHMDKWWQCIFGTEKEVHRDLTCPKREALRAGARILLLWNDDSTIRPGGGGERWVQAKSQMQPAISEPHNAWWLFHATILHPPRLSKYLIGFPPLTDPLVLTYPSQKGGLFQLKPLKIITVLLPGLLAELSWAECMRCVQASDVSMTLPPIRRLLCSTSSTGIITSSAPLLDRCWVSHCATCGYDNGL